jgi:hypothetical protein
MPKGHKRRGRAAAPAVVCGLCAGAARKQDGTGILLPELKKQQGAESNPTPRVIFMKQCRGGGRDGLVPHTDWAISSLLLLHP